MNELNIFHYQSSQIRTVADEQGNPWFVAKDICNVLELTDARKSVELLEEDERNTIPVTDSLGRLQDTFIINEAGLYSLILRSRKPEARGFKHWVTHDVIPSIRKKGVYATPQILERIIANPDLMIGLCQELKKERAEKEELAVQKTIMAPKAEFYDAVTGSRSAIDIGRVAKVLNFRNVGRNTLFKILRDKGILMQGNIPYQEYIDRGYFRTIEQKYTTSEGETRISIKTVVFQKGVDFIRKQLLKSGFEMQNMHAVEEVVNR